MAAKELCGARARIPPVPNVHVQQLHTEAQGIPSPLTMNMVELQPGTTALTLTVHDPLDSGQGQAQHHHLVPPRRKCDFILGRPMFPPQSPSLTLALLHHRALHSQTSFPGPHLLQRAGLGSA